MNIPIHGGKFDYLIDGRKDKRQHTCPSCTNTWPCRYDTCSFTDAYKCIPCKIKSHQWARESA